MSEMDFGRFRYVAPERGNPDWAKPGRHRKAADIANYRHAWIGSDMPRVSKTWKRGGGLDVRLRPPRFGPDIWQAADGKWHFAQDVGRDELIAAIHLAEAKERNDNAG